MYVLRPDGRVVEIDDPVAIKRFLAKAGWKEAGEEQIKEYELKKAHLIAQTKASAGEADNTVYYQTVSSSPNGYGMSRDIIKKELFHLGILMQEEYKKQKVGLLYSYPTSINSIQNDVRLLMTMFESDRIPEDWPKYLSQANEVIVPSKWCSDVFAKSGISTTVVPLGYNDRAFQYIERKLPFESEKPFKFIHYDSFTIRKGFSEVFKAFNEEFSSDEPVELILKTTDRRLPFPIMKDQYPNVQVITKGMSEKELSDFLAEANCMVYPSRGEGFGITPLEAMATGLPAIVPNAHGISEYFNSNYMLEVKVKEKCPGLYKGFQNQDVGEMVICDVEHLKKQMRYAYNHQKEMKELGKSASNYVKKFTYRDTAKKLAEIINKWQETDVVKRTDAKYLDVEVV